MTNYSIESIVHRPTEGESPSDIHLDGGINRTLVDPIRQKRSCKSPSTAEKHLHFPSEIWFEIAFHSACLVTRHGHSAVATCSDNKHRTYLLRHLGSVSKFHRKIVLRYWMCTMHLLEQVDPEILRNLGMANGIDLMSCVRRLVCRNEYNVYQAPKHAFEGFGLIEELVLNCHQDINFGGEFGQQQHPHIHAELQTAGIQTDQQNTQGNTGGNAHPQPVRMSYRKLRVNFPSTLLTLRVYDSHVPDIYFIQQVAEQCPLLESLTLSRCTLFTHQGCEFWRRLPRTESDAYFSNQGVSGYAVSYTTPITISLEISYSLVLQSAIGRELKCIKNLKELYIGIYLTDHTAIETHLEQHAGLSQLSTVGLGVWDKPCEECVAQYQEPTIAAEVEASEILAKEVPTLLAVSWASFCSEKRIGWSTHQIMRDEKGEFQGVSEPTSRIAIEWVYKVNR